MIERRGLRLGPEPLDVAARLLQHRRLGVAKAIDRLLPIADDEDRGFGREAEPLAPGLDEQRDELPLRPAGVLELVDEHVVVSRLEPEATLGELVHPPQQLERPVEDVGEVQHGPIVERSAVLGQRDREHPPDPA